MTKCPICSNVELKDWVKAIRKELKLSARAMSFALGMSHNYVYKVENGLMSVPYDMIIRIKNLKKDNVGNTINQEFECE